MSMRLSDLSVLAYANNFTMWHYKTEDNSVMTAHYFDNASEIMNINDLIIANIDIEGTPVTDFYLVTDITGGAVTIAAYS